QEKGRCRRDHRCEKLLSGDRGGRGDAGPCLPEACAGRAPCLRSRLRPEPDGALGSERKVKKHGWGRQTRPTGVGVQPLSVMHLQRQESPFWSVAWSIWGPSFFGDGPVLRLR